MFLIAKLRYAMMAILDINDKFSKVVSFRFETFHSYLHQLTSLTKKDGVVDSNQSLCDVYFIKKLPPEIAANKSFFNKK